MVNHLMELLGPLHLVWFTAFFQEMLRETAAPCLVYGACLEYYSW